MLVVYLLSHGGAITVVPNALQVGGHVARTAAPHQEIPAKLEVQCGKAGVLLACLDAGQALVDRKRFYRGIVRRRSHLQVHAAEEPFVIGQLPGFERGVGFGGVKEVQRTDLSRIVAPVICPRDQQESRCIGVGNNQVVAGYIHLAAFVHCAQDRAELYAGRLQAGFFGFKLLSRQSRGDPKAGVSNCLALEDHTIGGSCRGLAILRARQCRMK